MVRSFLPKFSSRSERRLLALCKNDPDDDPDIKNWNKNAVQYLVKKLKKNLDIINELEKAISSECANTKCVPLPKTPDNRLLVSHRRGLPQVIYCRLWRWPDLQSHHQIRAIPTCEYSNLEETSPQDRALRSESVCVNPYHYERNKPASLEPVLVPCSRIPPDLSTSFEDSDPNGGTKAIPGCRLPNLITGATVRSLLSADSPLLTGPNPEATASVLKQESDSNPSTLQALSVQSSSNTVVTMTDQQNNPNSNLPQQLDPDMPAQGDGEVYMSFDDREQSAYLSPRNEPEAYDYLRPIPIISDEPQQYDQQIYAEPQSQLFLPEQQPPQQQQSQQQQHMHQPQLIQQQQQQHIHQSLHEQQPQQQPQQIPVSRPIQAQAQPPAQTQQEQIALHPHQQHMPAPHQQMPPPPATHQQQQAQQHQLPQQQQQHIPPQHLNQPQQIMMRQAQQQPQQHLQQTHIAQQYQPQQQQQTSSQQQGTMIRQSSEIAHPYQFKQNKFSQLARAMHEPHSAGSTGGGGAGGGTIGQQPPHSCYDPHGYVTRPYPYNQHPQQIQVPYSQSHYQQQPAQQGVSPSTYSMHAQYPPHPPPSYATIYPQQEPYPGLEQMQLDYQQEVPMAVGGSQQQQQQGVYYESGPMAGPSHSVDQSMQQGDQQQLTIPTIDFQEVPYCEGASWCSITYHEYDQRVGEKYQPSCFAVSVDGFTHPACSDRYCIGGLSNVNRNEFTEWVRRRIGKGVKLTYVDGEVYVECLCDASIFVSSPMLALEEGKEIPERVSKVTHGSSVRVFSNPQFSKLLAGAVSKGFEAVYKLTNYCTFRVSFVKGWGRSYKRQTILNTPCWVEVQLNGPLLWIDKVLRQMKPPQGCGSTS